MHSLVDLPATKSGELSPEELALSERLTKLRKAVSRETHCKACDKQFTVFRNETLPFRQPKAAQEVVKIGVCNCTDDATPG